MTYSSSSRNKALDGPNHIEPPGPAEHRFPYSFHGVTEEDIAKVFFTSMIHFDKRDLAMCRGVTRLWRDAVDSLTDLWWRTPLHKAVEDNRVDICHLIWANDKEAAHWVTDQEWVDWMEQAAKWNRLEMCKFIMEHADDEQGDVLWSGLLMAVKSGHRDVSSLILGTIAERYGTDRQWGFLRTPLDEAARKGHTHIFSDILDSVAEDTAQLANPFCIAAGAGHIDICKLILNRGGDGQYLGYEDALHSAARKGHTEIFRLIADQAEKPNPADEYHRTPLLAAAEEGHVEIVEIITDSVDNLNKHLGQVGRWCPLTEAARRGFLNICQIIMEKIDDKALLVKPLRVAAESGQEAVCRLLMDSLDNKNPPEEKSPAEAGMGVTPLHGAAGRGHTSICKLFMDCVEDKNPKDAQGVTPLHRAAQWGHKATCSLILNEVEDKNPADYNGWTPLKLAAKHNHWEVYKLIQGCLDYNSTLL